MKIEKGVKLPPPKREYPLEEMKRGDSFLLKDRNERSIRTMVSRWNERYYPRRFVVRKVEDGLRIWRER